jgi:hypothetical protein
MNQQPSALFHADRLEKEGDIQAARELRRLYEVNTELLEALQLAYRHLNGGKDSLTPTEFDRAFKLVGAAITKWSKE